jgi:hypothetical protein
MRSTVERAMRAWQTAEPTLEELLGDEIMVPVMRSAGLDAEQLRALITEQARRMRSGEA